MRVTKEDIVDFRGGVLPTECDFCRKAKIVEELEPEEGSTWVCHSCLRMWGELPPLKE